MDKVKLQEMWDDMARSASWNYETCKSLCDEAGGDFPERWENAGAMDFEPLMGIVARHLGLRDTEFGYVDVSVNLSDTEKASLEKDFPEMEFGEIAERLLVALVRGDIPREVVMGGKFDRHYRFMDYLKDTDSVGEAVDLLEKSNDGDEQASYDLQMLFDSYSDTLEELGEDFESAMESLRLERILAKGIKR